MRRAILNGFLDTGRKRTRWRRIAPLEYVPEELPPASSATDARLDLHEELRKLAPRERACLVLRYYDDLKVDDIAEALGISPGTVKRYLSDGLAKMAIALADDGTAADRLGPAGARPKTTKRRQPRRPSRRPRRTEEGTIVPSESELRSRMRDAGEPPAELDVARVIRRARLRRLPRILAIGGAACLTVAAVAVPVTRVDAECGPERAPRSSRATRPEASRPPSRPPATPSCALPPTRSTSAPVPSPNSPRPRADSSSPIAPIDAPADATLIEAVVTLANNGASTVRGTTGGTPALTLSQDGLVLWHSNGPTTMIAVDVDLDPGESMQYVGSFEPVRCGAEDDADPSGFRPGLPPVGPGEYALSAAIDVSLVDGVSPELVTGPPTTVVLR